ncbi:MAG: class I SAM-dependent methyltransferase [Pyrinomonadaceae bacterium]
MMKSTDDFEAAIERLDTELFEQIYSQTTVADKRSLLAIQRSFRQSGEYVYLEIGSHLGGTIQPHLLDPYCVKIYSIDSRPAIASDVRGDQPYPDNSTERMLGLLAKVAPQNLAKIETFDAVSSRIDTSSIMPKPNLCFIDGEHTDMAVIADFEFCLQTAAQNCTIVFHDSDLVYRGIRRIIADLNKQGLPHTPMKLGGSVFAIAFGRSRTPSDPFIHSTSRRNVRFHMLRSSAVRRLKSLKRMLKRQ